MRCVPPQNKPTPAEIATCRPFLAARLAALPRLRAVLCLGRIAHETLLRTLGRRLADHPFAHGARHDLGRLAVFDSYHCSRYNTNTGRLTPAMFEAVFADLRAYLDSVEAPARFASIQRCSAVVCTAQDCPARRPSSAKRSPQHEVRLHAVCGITFSFGIRTPASASRSAPPPSPPASG